MTAPGPDDRVVLVAGASGALGRMTAAAFAKRGDRLVLGGRNRDRLETIAAEPGTG